jgi:hypothetical protein
MAHEFTPDDRPCFTYPGPKVWSSLGGGYFSENEPCDFVAVKNPLDRRVRVVICIGNDPKLHQRLEQRRPESERLPPEVIAARLKNYQPIRREYVHTEIIWAPNQVHWIPKSWLEALRKVDKRTGLVVCGLFHECTVVGEKHPPEIHEALKPEPEPNRSRGRTR